MTSEPNMKQVVLSTQADRDAEAAVVCGGVALAGSRRQLRGYRNEIWISHAGQAAVGISIMVMSVVILCFMVDRVSEGKMQFVKSQNLWATAFAATTLHLILRPISLILFLLMPCLSRTRLHIITKIVAWFSFNMNITMFIQVMIWRVNYAGCDMLDLGPDDLSCGDARRIGEAAMVMQIGIQFFLDIWNLTILRRVSLLHRDPVTHEALSSEFPWVRQKALFRWLLHEKGTESTGCTILVKKPEVNYDHKKVDIELNERRRNSSSTTLGTRESRDFGTVTEVEAAEKKSWLGMSTVRL